MNEEDDEEGGRVMRRKGKRRGRQWHVSEADKTKGTK